MHQRNLKKIGKIFDPTDFELPLDCKEFAQSPQTLIFDDFVRIYFSTRAKDPSNGKYISHIAFVDMDLELKKVLKISDKPVINLGELGTFDEHGIFPINILRHEEQILGYTCGWSRRAAVSVETSVGLVFSEDQGITFKRKFNGPILSSSLNEPFLVGDAFVKFFNNTFYMWYIFGTEWINFSKDSQPDRVYKIGQATSKDGINWNKLEGKAIIPDTLEEFESQALPTVIDIDNRYYMCFCYRESFDFRKNKLRGYRLGFAYSDDLITWTRDDSIFNMEKSLDGDWDSDMKCYPHFFKTKDNIYLLYNGNEFGKNGFGACKLA